MGQQKLNRRNAPVIVALLVLVIFAVFAVIMLVQFSHEPTVEATPEPPSAESYRSRVDSLLAMGKPEDAEAALTKYACHACHIAGNTTIAPEWAGLVGIAAERRPPMPADAYIYESIVFPGVFVVQGYNDVMPHDFGARMSEQELADVLAYLLTQGAQ